MASQHRGEVWLSDLGIAAKVRPALILSIAPADEDRMLVTIVPHTTSVRGSQFEVSVPKKFLKAGAFDAQGIVTITPPRLVRKLGALESNELSLIEKAVQRWLGL
jgi:mRNA interferase MazF